MENLKIRKASRLIQICIPGSIYIISVFILLFLINSDNFNKYFTNNYGLLVGSRWFSYQYTSDKYFHPYMDKEYINKSEAIHQISQIAKLRNFTESKTEILNKIIDSFSMNSVYQKNGEKEINATELNIKLDEMK